MRPLTFVEHPARRPLIAQEVYYWKRELARILKIGAEFEFNLPEKATGTCKGKNFTCPCVNYKSPDHDCWTKCLNEETCSTVPSVAKCSNFKSGCSVEKCPSCKEYSFKCIGIACSSIIPKCSICPDFEMNCVACEYRFDPSKNPEAIRAACTADYAPSGYYGVYSPTGVHNVVTDGSLLGQKGMEVITTGRRVGYWEFFNMASRIINTAVSKGAFVNERCSIHMHGLTTYHGRVTGMGGPDGAPSRGGDKINELERPMPEIIAANLHQLFRRYQNAITWMTSGLEDPKHLTRWEKFRVSVLEIPAVMQSMRDVAENVRKNSGGNKYGWVNYKYVSFMPNGDIDRLHVELRVMDGLLSPSAVAAFACLYYALFLKAVELSRYGVIEVGDEEWFQQAREVKDALMNNTSDWEHGNKFGRFSDTSKLKKYTEILVTESYELISHLKHILSSVGPAYEVLEKLAEMPCSVRRCDGKSWEEIEAALSVELTEEGILEYNIQKLVDTRAVTDKPDMKSWLTETVQLLAAVPEVVVPGGSTEELFDKVHMFVTDKQQIGEMIWADKIGSFIAV